MLSRPPSPNYIYPPQELSSEPLPPPPMIKSHNSLDIVLPTTSLCLRGTGLDVQPCWLTGNIVLNLIEPTTFKEITLQFRGKSRVPLYHSESSSVLGGNYQTQTVISHEWSFLQSELTHSPTLKAGRHAFPFKLQLDDSLPSTVVVPSSLSAVSYKLRATAVRPGFSSNLHATVPVRILRTFAPEALEYQQTLEIENTWPEKLMYSMMLPHKAWAIGDTVATLVKFSPLVKGVRITGITLTLQEQIKTHTRSGPPHETTRPIAVAKHELRDGHAVLVHQFGYQTSQRSPSPWSAAPYSPALSDGIRTPIYDGTNPVDPFAPGFNSDDVPHSSAETSEQPHLGPSSAFMSNNSPPYSSRSAASSNPALDIGEEEAVTTLHLPIPSYVTPTHAIEPIVVNHRLRYTILMSNPDGHVSELRCSLPIHILDHALLEDARSATHVTRRMLFGLENGQGTQPGGDVQLPSYPAHVMDRVPSDDNLVAGGGVALEWVNSQLNGFDAQRSRESRTPPDSTPTSRHVSRASSRATSPDRDSRHQIGGQAGATRPHPLGRNPRHQERERHNIFSLKPFTKFASGSNFLRQPHHEPLQSSPLATPSQICSIPASTGHTPPEEVSPFFGSRPPFQPSGQAQPTASSSTATSPADPITPLPPDDPLCRVPHYDIASRGFLGGGVMPLSTMRGLPSYEEAARSGSASGGLSASEKSFSEGDLATRFARAMRMP